MFTHAKLRVCVLIAILLALTPAAYAKPLPQDGTPPTLNAQGFTRQALTDFTHKDRDWPIIQEFTQQVKDPITGEIYQRTVVVRALRGGAGVGSTQSPCSTADIQPAQACTKVGTTSRTVTDSHLSGISVTIVHYADWWTGNGNDLYQPTSLEVQWTRTATAYTVDNAKTIWGCDNCVDCNNNPKNIVVRDGPFTPSWQGGSNWNKTYTYLYVGHNFVPMQDVFSSVSGSSTSNAYRNRVTYGYLSAVAGF